MSHLETSVKGVISLGTFVCLLLATNTFRIVEVYFPQCECDFLENFDSSAAARWTKNRVITFSNAEQYAVCDLSIGKGGN